MKDIINARPDTHIVTGFYTPNYAPLAALFAQNLSAHKIPHHLYAVSQKEWTRAILMKPEVVLKALRDYPDRSIILSDIDCVMRGPVGWAVPHNCDIAIHTRCKLVRRRKTLQPWTTKRRSTIWPSSRFVVFKNNATAKRVVERWLALCTAELGKQDPWDDEILLQKALSETPRVMVELLAPEFAAHEIDEAPDDAIVVHKSAHDSVRAANASRRKLKLAKRAFLDRVFGEPA